MRNIFDMVKLGSVASVKSGYPFKGSDMGDTGAPVIKIRNINPPSIDLNNVARIPSYIVEGNSKAEKFRLKKGDILIALTGAKVGKIGRFPESKEKFYLNQRVGKLFLTNPKKADYDFLYYVLSQPIYAAQIFGTASGSAQANISGAQIDNFKIPLTALSEQKAIASVLGALDKKIESNCLMNKTLDEMAKAIFKSWFVDFDPVHAKKTGEQPAHMDSATADLFPSTFNSNGLPDGWNIKTYECAIKIHNHKQKSLTKTERENRQGKYPYHGATSIIDYVDHYIFDGTYLLMGKDGSVVKENGTPFLQYVWGKFCANEHSHILQGANGFSTEFLLCSLSLSNISPYVTGAVQLGLNQANMKKIPLLIPPKKVLAAFDKIILPLFDKLKKNSDENKTLSEMRDLLLPKLISGEIRVKNAEKIIGETK